MEQDYSEHVKKIRVVIPLPESAQNGVYRITATAENEDGEAMSQADSDIFRYELPPDVPDTGSFSILQNIAKTDFLITGLLIFFITSVAGLIILTKKKRA